LLCQLNRAAEEEKNKRPELRHLRESGAIEQDADVVLLTYRAAYYGIDSVTLHLGQGRNTTINSEGVGELIIAKQRDGAVGSVVFRHNESLTKLDNYN
jgi:replicative DNA helicase